MNTHDLEERSARLLALLRTHGLKVVTAESCTGGLVAGALTAIAGSSDVVDRGFVTYSNAAKTDMLGIPAELITKHGAVSEPVARAMAEGALSRSAAESAWPSRGLPDQAAPRIPSPSDWCIWQRRDAAGRHCISNGDTAISAARRCGMQPCSTRSN